MHDRGATRISFRTIVVYDILPPLAEIIAKHGVHFHMYANATQLYLDFSPEDEVSVHATIAGCVKEIKAWRSDNFLLLNENKIEAMTGMPVNQPAVAKSIKLGDVIVPLSASVTNLGAVFDKKCRMGEHAIRVCRGANYYLHRIRRIRDCLNFSNTKLLVHSLVTLRLDYANGLLHNAPIGVIKKLDCMQRSSACVVCHLHKYQRVSMTEVLHDLHLLPVASRIKYKLLIVTHQLGPRYEGRRMSEPIPPSAQSSSYSLTTLSSYVSTDRRAVTDMNGWYRRGRWLHTIFGRLRRRECCMLGAPSSQPTVPLHELPSARLVIHRQTSAHERGKWTRSVQSRSGILAYLCTWQHWLWITVELHIPGARHEEAVAREGGRYSPVR